MPTIRGQSILIIGGSSGIGAAVAKYACGDGVKVSVASSNKGRVEKALKKIQALVPASEILGFTVDLSQYDLESRLEKLFKEVVDATGGPLDHVVMTAGTGNMVSLSEYTAKAFQESAPLHFIAPLMVGKVAPRFMNRHWKSSITFTSGAFGKKPAKGYCVIASAVGALDAATRALALELAPIRVNAVSPGPTVTEMFGPPSEALDKAVAAMGAQSLLGKLGRPEDVAEAYIYLMRDANTTGTIVDSNGGAFLQ
ncbi:Atr9 [Stachybotrys chlorohalonatus IBT 40285]|uniref:Short-chain dehydrogenase/reductase ATR9 n=1 Tax=Stachybotrys chlorohalonatus (strain IBT 40285) TaxID=1283841 RepID=ATR9_STAC4|nr:RecName: Full=Short-chain dehydrogenase/reductase ATR9; AltName: Full=Core atranone cluster (CAC) protein 9 [Stachybotrys chlorohalonata IBT 40285]KFA70087.1 Atr9 [Stachybotrys chlorohalonata IBT 40285]